MGGGGGVCVCVLREPLHRIVSSAPYKTGVCVCVYLPSAAICVGLRAWAMNSRRLFILHCTYCLGKYLHVYIYIAVYINIVYVMHAFSVLTLLLAFVLFLYACQINETYFSLVYVFYSYTYTHTTFICIYLHISSCSIWRFYLLTKSSLKCFTFNAKNAAVVNAEAEYFCDRQMLYVHDWSRSFQRWFCVIIRTHLKCKHGECFTLKTTINIYIYYICIILSKDMSSLIGWCIIVPKSNFRHLVHTLMPLKCETLNSSLSLNCFAIIFRFFIINWKKNCLPVVFKEIRKTKGRRRITLNRDHACSHTSTEINCIFEDSEQRFDESHLHTYLLYT